MVVRRIVTPNRWVGLSTDTKPTQAVTPSVRVGDTFYERDTGVLSITYDGTNWVIKEGLPVLKEVRVAVVIDGSDASGVFSANDVLGNDDCCSTTAAYWTFSDMARSNGGKGTIVSASIFCETENINPQLSIILFNAPPTGELRSNFPNTNPLPADRTKYINSIDFPALKAISASVASVSEATPSTVGNIPFSFQCASGTKDIYGVLVTNTGFTLTDTDDIEITLMVKQQ